MTLSSKSKSKCFKVVTRFKSIWMMPNTASLQQSGVRCECRLSALFNNWFQKIILYKPLTVLNSRTPPPTHPPPPRHCHMPSPLPWDFAVTFSFCLFCVFTLVKVFSEFRQLSHSNRCLRSLRPFWYLELTREFLILKNVAHCWFVHSQSFSTFSPIFLFCFFILMMTLIQRIPVNAYQMKFQC